MWRSVVGLCEVLGVTSECRRSARGTQSPEFMTPTTPCWVHRMRVTGYVLLPAPWVACNTPQDGVRQTFARPGATTAFKLRSATCGARVVM